jgi:hypothetical protein
MSVKVAIKHDDVWLLIKEVYALRRQSKRRGRQKQQRRSIPYGMVAVSVEKPPIDGMKYRVEIEVPASKATRFAIKMYQASGDAVVLIEPLTVDKYRAVIYTKTREEAERLGRLAERVIAQLRTKRGRGEESEAGEVEELEEEAVEEELEE